MKVTRKILSISIALLFITSFIALDTETGKANPAEVIYNDFNDGTLGTNTGGNAGAMSPTGEDAPTINFTTASKEGDYALSIQYDFPSGSWEGYWSYFNADESSYDLSNYTDIRMWVKGASGGEIFKVELKDASGQTSSVYITAASGFSDGATTSWQELVISLSSFSGVNMGQITQVNLVFDESPRSGTVYIDKMRFTDLTEEGPTYEGLILDAFNDGSGPNDLGGSCGTMDSNPDSSNETISETYVQDSYEGLGALRLTYDRGDNWVGYWSYMQSDQSGYDVSSYELIRMFVKGASGGEIFKVELEDTSNNNAHNYIDSYSGFTNGATKSWQELVIPLSDFSGVNMSQLRQVNIVFDHSPDSGIVYLDLVRFTSGQPPVADVSASPTSGTEPLTVNFDASGSSDSDGSIQSYSWDFGDGTLGTGETTSHEYSTGSYTATLTVTDGDGLTDSATASISVTTGEETTVAVSPTSQEIFREDSFTVDLNVNPGGEIAGVQLNLNFDPTYLTADSVTEGDLFTSSYKHENINNESGQIELAIARTGEGGVSSSGTLATINFTAQEIGGTSQLTLSNIIVSDPNGNELPYSKTEGSITVTTYQDWDINKDEAINVQDMVLIGQHWGETGSNHWIRADVNRDGIIDVGDMVLIGQNWTG